MIISLLQAHGEVSLDLRDKINAIEDISILERLVRQAASASSTEAFEAALKKEWDCMAGNGDVEDAN